MLYIKPDFYGDFKCIADKCRHSCCIGWEIDIDDDSLTRYASVGGEMGKRLNDSISSEPTPHFILTKDSRCPFLNTDGLCELILKLGEDSICDICTEHPRFYNEFDGRLEIGLGLCCEEAARLLTEGAAPLQFTVEWDGVDDPYDESELLSLREDVFCILDNTALSMTERMREALGLFNEQSLHFDTKAAAVFLRSLERMDEAWTVLLDSLESRGSETVLEPRLSDIRYTRIAAYLIYRHFAGGREPGEALRRLKFCFFSTVLICCLDCIRPNGDALRLFSAEIEYSEENLARCIDYVNHIM